MQTDDLTPNLWGALTNDLTPKLEVRDASPNQDRAPDAVVFDPDR